MSDKKPNTERSMLRYVHRKADADLARQSDVPRYNLDDFKVPVKGTPPMTKAGNSRELLSSREEKPQGGKHELAQTVTHTERRFYDTDTSNLELSSALASEAEHGGATAHRRQAPRHEEADQPNRNDIGRVEAVDEDDFEESSPEVGDRLPYGPSLDQVKAEHEGGAKRREQPGVGLSRSKTNSYPSTTSGNPSTVAHVEGTATQLRDADLERRHQYPVFPAVQGAAPFKSHFADRLLSSNGIDFAEDAIFSAAPSCHQRKTSRTRFPQEGQLHESYDAASEAWPSMHPAPFGLGSPVGSPSPNGEMRRMLAVHGSPRHNGMKRRSGLLSSPPRRLVVVKPDIGQDPRIAHKHEHVNQRVERYSNHTQYAEASRVPYRDIARDTNPDQQRMEDAQVILDVAPDVLHKMRYEDIRNMPFDKVSAKYAQVSPEVNNDTDKDTLEDKLGAMLSSSPQNQTKLLSSLTIDQWDEAGDWFLERFAGVVSRLKGARRARRNCTLGFEEEIAKRHEGVMRKRRRTDAALGEMRKSGGKVLEKTPKTPGT